MAQSTSEAIRMIQQGAVKLEGKKVEKKETMLTKGTTNLVQVGKRKIAKILIS